MFKNLSHADFYFGSKYEKRAAICGGLLKLETHNLHLPKFFFNNSAHFILAVSISV